MKHRVLNLIYHGPCVAQHITGPSRG